jgi:hypothetical protein
MISLSISEAFQGLLRNLAVDNAETISLRYGELTAALNKKFRETESKTANSLQVGSYGRWTAIKGISDLDMLYVMPRGKWETYRSGGQSKLLTDTADAIRARYPQTTVSVDRLVVRVLYTSFHVEVQPVFELEDGGFYYPDTYNGGSWKTTKPKAEIKAMTEFATQKNDNLRRLCKMARAWKNKHGVGMGGLLIDTLAHDFLMSSDEYDSKSYLYYDEMSRDFFLYLSELPKQEYFVALGSRQRVRVKKNFQGKAAKAYELCLKAVEAEGQNNRNDKWRLIYGRSFPAPATMQKSAVAEDYRLNTETFIEDIFPVDVRYNISIDCEVTQDGFRPAKLREMLSRRTFLMPRKRLRFHVTSTDIPGDYGLFWKVLNRGSEAIRRKNIRGQIVADKGRKEIIERTSFKGEHIVECYAILNGAVVATDRIHVPITANIEDIDG